MQRNVILTAAGVFLASSLPLIMSIWIAGRSVYENRMLVVDSRMTADLRLAAMVLEEHLDEVSTDLLLLASMIEASGVPVSADDALSTPVTSFAKSLLREESSYLRVAFIDAATGEIIDISGRESSEPDGPPNPRLLQSLLSDVVGNSASEPASDMAWHLSLRRRMESALGAMGPVLTVVAPLNGNRASGVALVLDPSEFLAHVFRVLTNNDYLARPLIVTADGDLLYASSQGSSERTAASAFSEDAREALLTHLLDGTEQSLSPVMIEGVGRAQTVSVTPREWRSEANRGLPAWTMVSYVANDTIGRLTPLQDPTWAPLSGTLRTLAFSNALLLAALSLLLAITLERLRAARQRFELDARFDPVTGLQNRRACEEILETALRQAFRHGTVLSIAIIDVDFFKQVNDRFGHPAGDVVLRGIARLMQATLGSSKNLFRLGGEEFLVLLPGVALAEAVVRVDTVREAIATQDFDLGNGTQHAVTVSAGVAERNHGHTTVSALLTAADAALYTAKREGRNCVRTFVEPSVN